MGFVLLPTAAELSFLRLLLLHLSLKVFQRLLHTLRCHCTICYLLKESRTALHRHTLILKPLPIVNIKTYKNVSYLILVILNKQNVAYGLLDLKWTAPLRLDSAGQDSRAEVLSFHKIPLIF